jgi:hypothetical protein
MKSTPRGRIVQSRIIATATVTAAILSIVATTACDQPKTTCVTARGDFAAKYTLVSGTGACAEKKGDTLGLQSYNALGKANRPDLEKVSIAIQAQELGTLMQAAEDQDIGDNDPTHKAYAFGAFTTAEPDGSDFCQVPTLAPAIQNLGTVPAIPPDPEDPKDKGTPEQAATNRKYEWSNVRVYVTTAATGTQMAADLTYTEDGCTATYKVAAVYPAHDCTNPETKGPDDARCATEADPAAGIDEGSGINPDFAVKCDPDLLVCVLSKDVPSFR